MVTAIVLGLFIPFFVFSQENTAEYFSVTITERVRPGDVVQVTVQSEIVLKRVQVRIVDPAGAATEFHAFHLPGDPGEPQTWVSLAGTPSTAEPGDYEIAILVLDDDQSHIVERTFRVEAQEFLRERIPLNSTMSDLRATDSERKRREALELLSVVQTVHEDAMFQFGPFHTPLIGARETAFFGDRRTYLYADGGRGYSIHTGWDLAAPIGTPVRSGGPGRVVMVAERLVTGNTIIIEHLPGVVSLYFHLDSVRVRVGDPVLQGQIIGTVGVTGLVTGPHLHWEIRVGGVAVDPTRLLDRPLVDTSRVLGTISGASQERG